MDYSEKNLILDVKPNNKYYTNASEVEGLITLNPNGTVQYNLLKGDIGSFATTGIRLEQQFNPLEVVNTFKVRTRIIVEYVKSNVKERKNVIFNRDETLDDDYYLNTSDMKLEYSEVQSITIIFENKSDKVVKIKGVTLRAFKDTLPYSLIEPFETDVGLLDTVSTNAIFTDSILTEYLETSMKAKLVRENEEENIEDINTLVEYIQTYSNMFLVRYENLNLDEVEPLTIPIPRPDGTIDVVPVYHGVSKKHPKRGKIFMTIHPRDRVKDLSDEQVEEYVVYRYKAETIKEKFAIRQQEGANGERVAVAIFGDGIDGILDITDMRGKGRIYADNLGLHLVYVDENGEKAEILLNGRINQTSGGEILEGVEAYEDGLKIFFKNVAQPIKVKWTYNTYGDIDGALVDDTQRIFLRSKLGSVDD